MRRSRRSSPAPSFEWTVGDRTSRRRRGGTRCGPTGPARGVRQWMRMGPARSGINVAIDAMPDKEEPHPPPPAGRAPGEHGGTLRASRSSPSPDPDAPTTAPPTGRDPRPGGDRPGLRDDPRPDALGAGLPASRSGEPHPGDDRRLARLARADRAERAARRRPPGRGRRLRRRRCRRTTSRRGASARASPASPGRGWARRWRRRRCRSASSTRPGQRYHPAIIAQAVATLLEMFPGRLWVALGTGEASNEHITGDRWPDKATRTARLGECVDVMRALFAGEEVTHHGLVDVDRARLWTLPATPPPLLGAAVSPATAALGRWLGRRPDHGEPGAGRAAPASSTRSAPAAARASRPTSRCT